MHKHCDKLTANPLMALLVGGTGSGKTYLLFQMLTTPNILDYERLIILTTTPDQVYFQFLKHGYENNLRKSIINKLFELYTNSDIKSDIAEICSQTAKVSGCTQPNPIQVVLTREITNLEQLNPHMLKTLVIFDDCVTERNQSAQSDIFTKGRHMNCHSIYLTQSFYDVKKSYAKMPTCLYFSNRMTKASLVFYKALRQACPKTTLKS